MANFAAWKEFQKCLGEKKKWFFFYSLCSYFTCHIWFAHMCILFFFSNAASWKHPQRWLADACTWTSCSRQNRTIYLTGKNVIFDIWPRFIFLIILYQAVMFTLLFVQPLILIQKVDEWVIVALFVMTLAIINSKWVLQDTDLIHSKIACFPFATGLSELEDIGCWIPGSLTPKLPTIHLCFSSSCLRCRSCPSKWTTSNRYYTYWFIFLNQKVYLSFYSHLSKYLLSSVIPEQHCKVGEAADQERRHGRSVPMWTTTTTMIFQAK